MRIDAFLASPVLTARSDVFARAVRLLGEACVYVNEEHLKEHKVPKLYSAGIRYQNEPTTSPDKLLDIPAIIRQGWGDCLHLSCWRVAELRASGERANLAFTWEKVILNGKPGRAFHCLVRRGNGSLEDPSVILGM